MNQIALIPLESADREQFIKDNQRAFLYGATEEFGIRDNHFEEDGEIISRETIETSIDGENAEAYRIFCNGEKVGGLVLNINKSLHYGELELFFIQPEKHSQGIGLAAWNAVEDMHPEINVWTTCTPYFEKRNIHFYVNRCGFHIVEFFNSHHPEPDAPENSGEQEDFDGMFLFEKVIPK